MTKNIKNYLLSSENVTAGGQRDFLSLFFLVAKHFHSANRLNMLLLLTTNGDVKICHSDLELESEFVAFTSLFTENKISKSEPEAVGTQGGIQAEPIDEMRI